MVNLLDQYELWKRRRIAAQNSSLRDYYADGIEIGEKLLQIGCDIDREGLDIRMQIEVLKSQLSHPENQEHEER